MGKYIEIMDTTLRDGLQQKGISVGASDLIDIGKELIKLEIPLIEAGQPMGRKPSRFAIDISNTRDKEVLMALRPEAENTKSVIMGLSDIRIPHINSVFEQKIDTISIYASFAKNHFKGGMKLYLNAINHAYRRRAKDIYLYMLYCPSADLKDIFKFCGAIKAHNKRTGDKINPHLIYCDTIGVACINDIKRDITEIKNELPDSKLLFHGHNDSGLAVANSLAAVEAGADGVSGTFMGIGERCGNASLDQIIYHLNNQGYETGLNGDMKEITKLCSYIAKKLGLEIPFDQPLVGECCK